MNAPRRVRGAALALVACTACAQIESRSTVTITPMPEAPAVTLGQAASEVVRRGTDVTWSQSQRTVELRLTQTRQCRAVLHQPVQRVEHVDRSVKYGALYFEYGAAAGLLALGIAALAKPDAFSPQAIDENGASTRDRSVGYRIGGVFTGLGLAMAGVGIYDTVRSRDATYRTKAYAVKLGDSAPCLEPQGPLADTAVTLSVGEWSSTLKADDQGIVRYELPDEKALGIELPEPPPPPPADPPAEDMPSEDTSDADAPADVPKGDASSDPAEAEGESAEPAPPPVPPPVPQVLVPVLVQAAGEEASFEILAPFDHDQARERGDTLTLAPPQDHPPKP